MRKCVLEFTHLKNEKATDTSQHEKELIHLKSFYSEQQTEFNSLQSALRKMEGERESFRHNVLVWSEQDKATEATIQRLKREGESNAQKKVHLKRQIKHFNGELSVLDPQVDEQLKKYKSKKSEFEVVNGRYKKAQDLLEKAQTDRWEAQRKMADDHSLLDRTLSLVKEKNNTITQLNEKITKIEISQKDQSKEQKDLDKKKTVLKKSTEKIHATLNQVREVLRTEQEKESALSIEIHRGKSKLESLESQAYFYHELVEQKDGYPEGVRTIRQQPKDSLKAHWQDLLLFDLHHIIPRHFR